MRQVLTRGIEQSGLSVEKDAAESMARYVELLVRWNRTYNLTAVRDPVEMVRRHVLDSLVILPHVRGKRLLDIGTGAGLPGLVLAIARPDLRCVLMDAAAKKTRFCRQAVAELGLSNVEVAHTRVEDYRPTGLFSTVVSRALGSIADLLRRGARLCLPGGIVLAMKGSYPGDELDQLGRLKASARIVPLRVPGLDAERHLVVISVAAADNGAPAPGTG